jgi:hypothetical protein
MRSPWSCRVALSRCYIHHVLLSCEIGEKPDVEQEGACAEAPFLAHVMGLATSSSGKWTANSEVNFSFGTSLETWESHEYGN